jgi:hypothetical protein
MTQISLGLMPARMLIIISRKLGLVTNAYVLNFIGRVWQEATKKYTSNFMGQQAGYQANAVYASNFCWWCWL